MSDLRSLPSLLFLRRIRPLIRNPSPVHHLQRNREESVAAAKAAAELKEEMRSGGGTGAGVARAGGGGGAGVTVVCEAGAEETAAGESGASAAWVMVIHGKTRFRMLLGSAGEAFGSFKERIAGVSKVHDPALSRWWLDEIGDCGAAAHSWHSVRERVLVEAPTTNRTFRKSEPGKKRTLRFPTRARRSAAQQLRPAGAWKVLDATGIISSPARHPTAKH